MARKREKRETRQAMNTKCRETARKQAVTGSEEHRTKTGSLRLDNRDI
jgi:hypothetical protein